MKLFRPQLLVVSLLASGSAVSAPYVEFGFLGEATFETGHIFEGVELGGLSGIDYDVATGNYIAISDDRAQNGPARFYELSIDLADGSLSDGDIEFLSMTEMLDRDGDSFLPASVDPEAIRIKGFPKLLYWTSEGDANAGVGPFVRIMTAQGDHVDEFQIPEKYFPTGDQGIRNNLAFESLTFSANGKHLYTATEGALVQDGPTATTENGSPVRILKLNGRTGEPMKEMIYLTDPVVDEPNPAGSFSTNGLVELMAVDHETFVAVERSFSVGAGNNIRLYLTWGQGASNVKNVTSIEEKRRLKVMKKHLLLDLADMGINPDNIEGITFGPDLPSGEKTLILVSDNNFNPNGQITQFLAFKVSY